MRPKLVASAIKDALNANGARVNFYIWGQAGIGKSAVVKQVADEAGVDFIDIRAAQMDPTDIRGIIVPEWLPTLENQPKRGVAAWLTPDWLPKRQDWVGIIMMDELNLAPILVQSACYQLIWDRATGDYELPAGAMICAAGNRKEDGAPAHNMPAPLRNRFVHIVFEPNLEDWSKWAMLNDIHPDVIAFCNSAAEMFAPVFKANAEENAFPSPRTWEFVSRLISGNYREPDCVRELIDGAVGKGAGAAFSAFQRVKDELPDMNAILTGVFPKKIPTKPDVLYLLSTTLAVKAVQSTDRSKVYETLFQFMEKVDSAEYQTLCFRLIATKDKDTMTKTQGWAKWIKKNQNVFL